MGFKEWWNKNGDTCGQCIREEEAKSIYEAGYNEGVRDVFNPQWSDEELKKFNESNNKPYEFNKLPHFEEIKEPSTFKEMYANIKNTMAKPYGTTPITYNEMDKGIMDEIIEYLRRRDDNVLKKLLSKMCGEEITEKMFKDFDYAKEILKNLHLRFEKVIYENTDSQKNLQFVSFKECMIMYQNDKEVAREYYDLEKTS